MRLLLSIVIVFMSLLTKAQSVGIGTTTPDTSAILDLTSTNKGILIPRITEASRLLIGDPAHGLMVFQSNSTVNSMKGFYFFDGSDDAWIKVGGPWIEDLEDADEVYTNEKVGIGSINPKTRLHITKGSEATLLDTSGYLLIGNTSTENIVIDNNEMQARNNNLSSSLSFQPHGGNIGIGTDSPSTSALLELNSTSKGFLLPRMTTTQRNAISSPSQGLKIFNIDDKCEDTYDGQKWSKNCDMKSNGSATLPADTWRIKSDFPGGERINAICFEIDSKIYVGLGQSSLSDTFFKKDFWEYDTYTDVWTQKADFAGGFRIKAVGFSRYGKGYVGTGRSPTNLYKDFWEYDPLTDVWTQKANFAGTARSGAVGLNGYIGTGNDVNGPISDFWRYNIDTDSWTQMANYGGGPLTNAYIFISDGDICVGASNQLWTYYSGPNTWIQRAGCPGNLSGSSFTFTLGAFGYIGGGGDQNNAEKDLWRFDGYVNLWLKLNEIGGKAKFGSVGCNGYVFGGLSDDGLPALDETWVYNANSVIGIEYIENIPQDATSYKGHAWTSEGSKIFTSIDGVEASVRGNLMATQNMAVGSSSQPVNKLQITGGSSLALADQTTGHLTIGYTSSTNANMVFDQNDIQAKSGSTNAANLNIQRLGGNLSLCSGGGALTIGEKVAINTSIDPTHYLKVYNGTSTGTYTTTGWVHASDQRLKTNIRPMVSSLDKIKLLKGVNYNWKSTPNTNPQIGFIAQEVEKIFPEVISVDENGFYSMAYQNLVAPLVEAIKEQQAMIEEMKLTNENLKASNKELHEKSEAMSADITSIKQYISSQNLVKNE